MGKRTKVDSGNFIMQAGILAAAGIIVRIIGLLYRAPLTAVIGDEGNGYYSFAYNIYANILLISSYSIPSAISKIMSQKIALKEYKNAQRIFKCAFVYVAIVGGAAAGFAFFAAGLLVVDNAIPVLRIFAPTILLSGFLGVFRGYFQAHRSMVPTSISQIIEQIANALISIGAAMLFINQAGADADDTVRAVKGASGSALGTGIGVLTALLFVGGIYLYNRDRILARVESDKAKELESYGSIAKDILLLVTPFILSTFIYNCSTAINQTIFAKVMQGKHNVAQSIVSTYYGIYSGKAVVLRNVPVALASAMSAAIIPTVATAWVLKEKKDARYKVRRAVKVTMIVAVPCVAMFLFLARPIVHFLFPQKSSLDLASKLLMCLAVTVVFYCLSTITNGVLQSIGLISRPVIHAAIALGVQSVLLWALLSYTQIGIYAIVIADIIFSVIVCILNSASLYKHMKYHQEWFTTFVLPAICSLIMGLIAKLIFNLIYHFSNSERISLIVAGIIAVIVYLFTIIQSGAISGGELEVYPGGPKLVLFLKKYRLISDKPKYHVGRNRVQQRRRTRNAGTNGRYRTDRDEFDDLMEDLETDTDKPSS